MRKYLVRLIGLAVVVLWTTSCAGATDVTPPQPGNTSTEKTLGGGSKKIGNWNVTLFSSPNPPIRGSNTVQALVADASGKPVTDATVSFDLDMTNMSHGKNVVTAKSAGSGRYAGTVVFMMPGPWRIVVAVGSPGQPVASDRFNFTVNLR